MASYRLQGRVGTTASSGLYLATSADGLSAIVRRSEAGMAGTLAAWQREASLMCSLQARTIGRPELPFEDADGLTMAFESLSGEALDQALAQQQFDVARSLRLALCMTVALAALHEAGIVLMDLRPAHWMVDLATDSATLVEASRATTDAAAADAPVPQATADWATLSPEQTGRMNRPVDRRSDFYGLGVVLYRMLAGQWPFSADDALGWVRCHLAQPPLPLAQAAPNVPASLAAVVDKLLAKLPEDRYQSARELQADLECRLADIEAGGRNETFVPGQQGRAEHFQRPQRLYGREREAGVLQAAFERVVDSGRPEFVTVAGSSGVGKSTLVRELNRTVAGAGGSFITGKFDPFQRDTPYLPLKQALRELVQQRLAESDAQLAGWRERLQAALGDNLALMVQLMPQLGLIVGPQPALPTASPAESQQRLLFVFRRFIAVFARREQPLLLFLDDLQWADDATLQIIEHLLSCVDSGALLLITTYRDPELPPALRKRLQAWREGGMPTTAIELLPLPFDTLRQFVAETLHADPAACEPLTHVVFTRTGGNPLHFTQLLESLRRNGDDRLWDLARIDGEGLGDDLARLMAHTLSGLPTATQQALHAAAFLGHRFEPVLLALALDAPVADTSAWLAPALHDGLLLRASPGDDSLRFGHDRIREAAYALSDGSEPAAVHLRIGRRLLAGLPPEQLATHLFDVVSQFERGTPAVADRAERLQIAALAQSAGRQAKAEAAFAAAAAHFASALALLDTADGAAPAGRDAQHTLAFELRLESAECESSVGRLDVADALIAALGRQASSRADRASVSHRKVLLHALKGQHAQAVDEALACLRLFGADIAAHPSAAEVQAEYDAVWQELGSRPIEALAALPLVSDPEQRALMHALSIPLEAAFLADPQLYHLLLCRMVRLVIRHGASAAAARACAYFGIVLGPVFNRYPDGRRFTDTAAALARRHGFNEHPARILHAVGMVAFWNRPASSAIEAMRVAARAADDSGDLVFACYSRALVVAGLLLRGDALDTLRQEAAQNVDFVHKACSGDMEELVRDQQRFIDALQGRTVALDSFTDASFDDAAFEAGLGPQRLPSMVCFHWILKLQLHFLAGEFPAAQAAAERARPLLHTAMAQIQFLDYHFFGALTLAALHDGAEAAERTQASAVIGIHLETLRKWAAARPASFADKQQLVEAELARIEGRDGDAMRLYEAAIAAAREYGLVHDEALAHELAAAFYGARGFAAFADLYLREAHRAYARWGATAKLRQLEAAHPALRAAVPTDSGAQLDLLSIMKASQEISAASCWPKWSTRCCGRCWKALMHSTARWCWCVTKAWCWPPKPASAARRSRWCMSRRAASRCRLTCCRRRC
ncbi:MAG: AAA family ATPase [Burkholderiales bacterium]|nr:AAA family ATPase [Burkholderiales bacterium]